MSLANSHGSKFGSTASQSSLAMIPQMWPMTVSATLWETQSQKIQLSHDWISSLQKLWDNIHCFELLYFWVISYNNKGTFSTIFCNSPLSQKLSQNKSLKIFNTYILEQVLCIDTITHCLTTGIYSAKCIIRQFRPCGEHHQVHLHTLKWYSLLHT